MVPDDPKPVDDPKPNDDPKPDPKPDDVDHKAEAEKWKAMARKHESQAKTNADAARKLKELDDAKKTDDQRSAERLAELEKKATDAEMRVLRSEVAADMGVPKELRQFLTATTQEDLEAQAELLMKHLPAKKSDEDDDNEDDDKSASRRKAPKGRPTEKLRSGATSTTEPEEMDPRKLAAGVPRY